MQRDRPKLASYSTKFEVKKVVNKEFDVKSNKITKNDEKRSNSTVRSVSASNDTQTRVKQTSKSITSHQNDKMTKYLNLDDIPDDFNVNIIIKPKLASNESKYDESIVHDTPSKGLPPLPIDIMNERQQEREKLLLAVCTPPKPTLKHDNFSNNHDSSIQASRITSNISNMNIRSTVSSPSDDSDEEIVRCIDRYIDIDINSRKDEAYRTNHHSKQTGQSKQSNTQSVNSANHQKHEKSPEKKLNEHDKLFYSKEPRKVEYKLVYARFL